MLPRLFTCLFLSAASAFSASQAVAADWWPYDNGRFGYHIELPPGFGLTILAERGDGLVLTPADKSARLLVFATHSAESDFSSEAKTRLVLAKQDGWQVSYSKLTAQGFSFTGVRRDRIVYGRGVALCNGASAFFQMDYTKADMQRYDAVVMRLARSLKATEKCTSGSAKPLFKGLAAATG
ncbi:MAG: hypothetical protein ABWY49_08155 [Rhizobium sp.]